MRVLPPAAYMSTAKGLWHNFRAREAIMPFYASFKLTSRCHFACPFCNMHAYPSPDLSTEGILKTLDNLSRSSVLMTSFEGGEPLLRDDIGELLKAARSKHFYLLFTSSARNILEYPMDEYARYIDFLHISIDEGHGNMSMFDTLSELAKLPCELSVQTVVTEDTLVAVEEKVSRCHALGANIVLIPASDMDGAKKKSFPNIDLFEQTLRQLKKKYPTTIHTPLGYFDAYRKGRCSSASIIIAPDGKIFYPCNILGKTGPSLEDVDLMEWLVTDEAAAARKEMRSCSVNCGWYQYYSIGAYLSVPTILDALGPALFGKQAYKRK